MSSGIKLWACAAICQDQTEREVIGLYQGDKCLLLSRPWRAPASIPVLQITARSVYPVLAAIISAADYRVHEGVWYGEIAISWKVLAALTARSQSTVYGALKVLAAERFIHYVPATGGSDATLVRVYPYNARTGVRLFQIEPSWLPGFEIEVVPRRALYEVAVGPKAVEFIKLAPDAPLADMSLSVSNAVVVIPSHINPENQGSCEKIVNCDEFLIRFKDVPGLDEIYRRNVGIDPDLGEKPSVTFGEDVNETMANWRADGFSQRGVEVRSGAVPDVAPKPTDLGLAPSWDVAAAADLAAANSGLPQDSGKTPFEADQAVENPNPSDPSPVFTEGTQTGRRDLSGSLDSVFGSSPKVGEAPCTGAFGAAAAPPRAAPPVASALFTMSKSERQLRQVQVDAIYKMRGERINNARRRRMTSKEVSCIETYERLAGIPFCAEDLPWLVKALTFTSHTFVLRSIGDRSRYDGGRYVLRGGMKDIWEALQKNKFMKAKAQGGKKKASPAGSSRSANVDQEMRKARKEAMARAAMPSQDVAVSQDAGPASTPPGIVSEATPGVAPEPKRQPV